MLKLKKENLRLTPKIILPCVALGMSAFIMQSSESVIFVCFNTSLRKYGGDVAVGAMTICSSVMQFIAYNFGARSAARVKETFRWLLGSCLGYSMLLWALIMIFPRTFAGMFTPNSDLLDFAAGAVRIYCAMLGIFGIQLACQMTFVSIGYAGCSILVAVVRKFVLLLPLIYIMPHLVSDPTTGVYLAEPVADFIAVSFTAILFSFQFRKAVRSLEPAAQ